MQGVWVSENIITISVKVLVIKLEYLQISVKPYRSKPYSSMVQSLSITIKEQIRVRLYGQNSLKRVYLIGCRYVYSYLFC